MDLTRRDLIVAALAAGLPLPAFAQGEVGQTLAAIGAASLQRGGSAGALAPASALFQGDTVETGADGFATLLLVTQAVISLGPASRITLDAFTASLDATISVGGAIAFDRPDDLPPAEHKVLTTFAQIGVRGTRFFAGPSQGSFAVFADRGEVRVTAGGQERVLAPGDGVEVAEGGAPGEVLRWSPERVAAAFASVGL